MSLHGFQQESQQNEHACTVFHEVEPTGHDSPLANIIRLAKRTWRHLHATYAQNS